MITFVVSWSIDEGLCDDCREQRTFWWHL